MYTTQVLSSLFCVAAVICLVKFSHGISVRCESSEDPTSSCRLSQSCQLENSVDQELVLCHRDYSPFNESSLYDGLNITECPRSDGFYDHCHARVAHTDESEQYFILHNVTSTLYSLSHEHFSMNVSWFYRAYDFGIASTQSSHPLVGYELRVKHSRDVIKCLCVWEINLNNLSLRFTPKLMYGHSSLGLSVKVSTLPYNSVRPEEFFEISETNAWPSSCNSELLAPYSSTYCPGPLHDSPRNIQFSYRTLEELQVSWSHPSVSPHPEIYYIYITDGQENFTILANMTQNITISNVNFTLQYSVQVQGHSHCSGLSNFISGSGEGIGCGLLSKSIAVELIESVPIVTSHISTTLMLNMTTFPPLRPTQSIAYYAAIAVPLILFFPLVLILMVLCAVILYRIPRPKPNDPIAPSNNLKSDVLVLYSQNTPLTEQIFIQTYVVARVKEEKLSVRSCNDHNFEKTMAQWVEEQVRHSSNIFIICNKSFYKEWNNEKSQLLNSLETIISSAASHQNIDKYATVVLGKRDKNLIPDNLYLKGMKSFVIGDHVKPKNMEEIVRFIKYNRSHH